MTTHCWLDIRLRGSLCWTASWWHGETHVEKNNLCVSLLNTETRMPTAGAPEYAGWMLTGPCYYPTGNNQFEPVWCGCK